MNNKTRVKLIIRSIILITITLLTLIDVKLLSKVMTTNIAGNIKVYMLLWMYLMYEMIVVFIPAFSLHSYSGKIYSKHFNEVENYSIEKLNKFTNENSIRAKKAILFWITLNLGIFIIFKIFNIDIVYMYFLFLFYYWSDMFCVNVWCPFHKIIVKNKCCNECRIYNWGHIMYLTPLIFINNIYTQSLVFMGLIIFIQWEYMNNKYPERMSSISNKSLRCGDCDNLCRFNKLKREKVKEQTVKSI